MEKIIATLIIVGLGAVVIFLAAIAATVVGALVGLVVGWLFGGTILSFFAALGITGFKMWQIGASLGFAGSFFKGYSISSKK